MELRAIKNDADHAEALAAIEALWGAAPGTPDGNTLDVLLDLVEHYETKNFVFPPSDPVDLIAAHMEATGRTNADLVRVLGSKSRASEIMNKKRSLTLQMIRQFESQWGLPAEGLIRAYELESV